MQVGTAVQWGDMANPTKTGYIAAIEANENKVYTIGGAGMVREHFKVFIAWDNNTFSEVSESMAQDWIDRAERSHIAPVDEATALSMLASAKEQRAREYAARMKASEEYAQKVSDWRDSIRDKIPSDAKAVIVAKYEEDKCDSQTDYFATQTTKTVILAFSTHTRDIFSEMRKAAKNYAATAYLADAPESAEHREKYSMGAGYYLKANHRYSSGWTVRKHTFYGTGNDIALNIPYAEWSVPEHTAAPERKPSQSGSTVSAEIDIDAPEGFTVSAHTHTKKGFQMFIVETAERVERETFMAWLEKAKGLRGWYTRKWGSTPAGFAFKDQDAARAFMEQVA